MNRVLSNVAALEWWTFSARFAGALGILLDRSFLELGLFLGLGSLCLVHLRLHERFRRRAIARPTLDNCVTLRILIWCQNCYNSRELTDVSRCSSILNSVTPSSFLPRSWIFWYEWCSDCHVLDEAAIIEPYIIATKWHFIKFVDARYLKHLFKKSLNDFNLTNLLSSARARGRSLAKTCLRGKSSMVIPFGLASVASVCGSVSAVPRSFSLSWSAFQTPKKCVLSNKSRTMPTISETPSANEERFFFSRSRHGLCQRKKNISMAK